MKSIKTWGFIPHSEFLIPHSREDFMSKELREKFETLKKRLAEIRGHL